ncbi:MAG: hypothetical protein K0S46_2587 [Moraxellaceae bacterium]|jgi:diguanylate cyclase (GGDEF)-like protein|nr:hypothetical protein [Moraxellaceae bacterium]
MGKPLSIRLHVLAALKWNSVERGCAPLLQILLIFAYYIAGARHVLARPDRERLVDAALLEAQLPVMSVLAGGALLLFLLGLALRQRRPDALWFQFLGSQYYCLALVWVGYLTGTLSFATGVVLMGATLTGYVLLDRRVILAGFGVAFTAVLALNLAALQGLLPYAPALRAPADVAGAVFWTHATLFIAAPHLLLSLVATGVMLTQWRRREAYITSIGLTDALTLVHNRRSIFDQLEAEVARARRQGTPLAVVLLDLDHFKRINDTWGHATGDRALREAAGLLAATLRQSDAIGRFGGEEFLLLLPDTPEEGARLLAERCRQQLAALELRADDGRRIPLSASFGLAAATGAAALEAGALVLAADTALYRAKQGGRNRVEAGEVAAADAGAAGSERHTPSRYTGLRRVLRQMLRGGQSWHVMDRVVLGLVMMGAMYAGFTAWALLARLRPDSAQIIDPVLAVEEFRLLLLALAGVGVLLLVALQLRRRGSESRLFQHIAQQYYGLTLVGFGTLVGMLTLPGGVVLAASPLVGFIFFEISIVCWSLLTSTLALFALAYASALGWLPYAPLIAEGVSRYQPLTPFWMASYYAFALPVMAMAIRLADRTLGSWRQRGEMLLQLSLTDMLTGAHNRGSILRQLDKELARARRQGTPLTVVLLDLDHFKRINDTWGHPTGDRVLQAAAGVLQASVRQCDAVGRYGGEEFLLLLPDTGHDGAAILLERCRQRLAELQVMADTGAPVPVTASFGYATTTDAPEAGAEALVQRADEALYRAKAAGRNCVEGPAPAPSSANVA